MNFLLAAAHQSNPTNLYVSVLLPIGIALVVLVLGLVGAGYVTFRANWVAAIEARRLQTALDIEELLVEVERRVILHNLLTWSEMKEVDIILSSAIRRARVFDNPTYGDRNLALKLQEITFALDSFKTLVEQQEGNQIVANTPAMRQAALQHGRIIDAVHAAQDAVASHVVKPRLGWNP
jgi:hypothetical protein